MSKEEPKEEGSMVSPDEAQREEQIKENVLNRLANAAEALAKVTSGIGVTLVTIKVAIDENTKAFQKAEDRLNSLVTLLAVGKKVEGEESPKTKPEPKSEPKPTPTPQPVEVKPETPQPQPPLPEPTPAPASAIDEVRMVFPEDLEALLNFEDKGDHITIKPKQFLGSENFAKIASAVRGMGGEYVSAGKDSHFRVKKTK